MGPGTLLKTTVCENSLSLYPQMQVKTLKHKEEIIYQQDPEMLPPSLGSSSFKTDRGEVEKGPVVQQISI